MKKQIWSLVFLTISGFGAAMGMAQDQDAPSAPPQGSDQARRPRMDPDLQLKMMTKHLKLTADQQSQILPILTATQTEMQKLRDDSSVAPEDRRSKMMAMREANETKINAVLNDDQKKTYAQMQQQMRERMQQRREQGQQNAGPDAPR